MKPRPVVLFTAAFGAGLATGLARFWAPPCVALILLLAFTWGRFSLGSMLAGAALCGVGSGAIAVVRDRFTCAARLPAGGIELRVRLGEPADSGGGIVPLRPQGAGCRGSVQGRWPRNQPAGAGYEFRIEGRWIRDSAGLQAGGILLVGNARELEARPSLEESLRTSIGRSTLMLYGARAPLVDALILNRRGDLAPELRESYAASGLVHLLSISGFHVGLIAGWLFLLARFARLTRHAAMMASALLSVLYVAFIGWPAPATRAALLVVLITWCHLRQRQVQPDALLAVTCLVVMVVDPWAILNLGAWLSAAALWGATRFSRWSDVALGPAAGWRLLASSVGATMATAPITAGALGTVALIGILLNFIAIPLAALAVPGVLASILLAPVSQPIASSLAAGAGACLELMDGLATLGGKVPGGHLVSEAGLRAAIPWAVGLVVAVWALDRRHGGGAVLHRLGFAAALLSWASAIAVAVPGTTDEESNLTLHFLNVGQGDGALIRTPGGHWVLLDAGPRTGGRDAGRSVVIPALRRLGARQLSVVILSHAHMDHLGGVAAVLKQFRSEVVIEPGDLFDDPLYFEFLDLAAAKGIPWHPGRAGERFEIDSVSFALLHPDTTWGEWGNDLNEDSIVLLMRYRGFEALFMGDAGMEAEARMRGRVGRIDFLKVGHHGSRTATSDAWLAELAPKAAVISVGVNRYGHPTQETLGRLAAHGVPFWRTDRDGEVTVSTDGATMRVCARSGCKAMPVVP